MGGFLIVRGGASHGDLSSLCMDYLSGGSGQRPAEWGRGWGFDMAAAWREGTGHNASPSRPMIFGVGGRGQ
jgi:hypothetical protein